MARRYNKRRKNRTKGKVIKKRNNGRRGGLFKVKKGRTTVSKFRKGKVSGYKVVKRPRRGKNKRLITTKVKVKR